MGDILCYDDILKVEEPKDFGLNHLQTSQPYCTKLIPLCFFFFPQVFSRKDHLRFLQHKKKKKWNQSLSKKDV